MRGSSLTDDVYSKELGEFDKNRTVAVRAGQIRVGLLL